MESYRDSMHVENTSMSYCADVLYRVNMRVRHVRSDLRAIRRLHKRGFRLHIKYHVPTWFVAENIKFGDELQNGKIRLVESGKASAQDTVGQYDVGEDRYVEFCNIAASALLGKNSSHGRRLDSLQPALRITTNSVEYSTALLEHLASDLSATFIAVDIEDLYDLAYDFYEQEMKYPDGHEGDDATSDNKPEISLPEQGDRDSMVGYYFGARCKRHSPPNSFRRGRNAIEAILDVPSGRNDKEKSSQAGQPVIIHLRDAGQVYNTPRGEKVIRNLRIGVQNVRKSNIPVLIIASYLQKSNDDDDDSNSVYSSESGDMWEDTISGLDRKLLVSSTAQFVFDSPLLPKQQTAIQSEVNQLHIKRETRRLAEALRCSLPEGVLSDTKPIDLSKYARDGRLPEIDRDRVVKQAVGLVARKGALGMNDLNQILDRAMRLNSRGYGSLAERLERIKADCNSFEAKLLHCIVDTDKQKVTYDDVIMNQASKDRVKTLVAMSRIQFEATSQELVNSTRISGALFHGPPGTGKTQLARAIASDSHATMLNVSPADIKSRWVGETQKSIKAAFSLAKKLSPCIIFIDEVDAVFYRRSSEDEAWQRQALTQFLQEMDGLLTGRDTPLVLGATNRPDDLDDAFSRRLPHKVMFELPGDEDRRKILNLFLKKSDLDPSFDMDSLIQSTNGYSGSDLRSLCAEAALTFATEHVNSQQPGHDGVIACKIVLKNDHFTEALRKNNRNASDWSYESEEFSEASEPDTPTRIFKKDLDAVDNLVTSPALQARLHHLSNLILA